MKFYSDLSEFNIKNFFPYPSHYNEYSIHHMYFYMCLLPQDLKNNLLNTFSAKSQSSYWTFSRILNIQDSFSNTIEECDYVILPPIFPNSLTSIKEIFFKFENILKEAVNKNKKILFFHGGDNNKKFNISEEYGYIFRCSGFLSQQNSNIFGCPTFNVYHPSKFLIKKNFSVSFCGYLDSSCQDNLGDDGYYHGIRKKIINQLSKKTYFDKILRSEWAGDEDRLDIDLYKKNKDEYYKNIENNLYGLCVRGGGNFSFRLVEVFMMGRIPVLIDTDCILPFKNQIPYETNTVYVTKENSNNFEDIDSVIRSYHYSHNEDELIEIQRQNLNIWIQYFTPDHAFKNTCKLLKSLK